MIKQTLTIIIKNSVWDFLLKFSTEMLIRKMNGTLTHNGAVYEKVFIWKYQNLYLPL